MTAAARTPALDRDDRTVELFTEHLHGVHRQTDRLFAALMALQWGFGVVLAVWISPLTWIGETASPHLHLWAAIFAGGALSAFPIVLALLRPGKRLTRHVMAISQMLWSALLIHLTGGRIETHFHVFGSLAFLALYRDWSVLLTAASVVAIDHFVRATYMPQSVFGVVAASQWRWMEHAAWVAFECVVLLRACRMSVREMWEIARRQSELETSNARIEAEVEKRTRELDEALAAAEEANRAKSEFLANMSHEIRTPMSSILGYSDLLLDSDQNLSERLNAVQTIRRNGQHLLGVINDILDISKIEAGKMTIERVETSPLRVVEDAASLMRGRAIEQNLDFKVEYESPVPRTILTDPMRLRQILVNLLGNAIKFTERGNVRLTVSMAGRRLRFTVADTGIGMSGDQLRRLFTPFSQADSSTARRFGGSGLGLTISKSFAEMLGGNITARSKPGVGSAFTVEIDAGEFDERDTINPESEADAYNSAHDDTTASQNAEAVSLRGLRILLAEDGVDNQRLISLLLRRADAEVVVVEDGRSACEEALRAAERNQPFDIVLMDMQMPVLDGYGAASRLRAHGYTRPIIALTAHAMAGDRERCIAAGCDDYLTKPVDRARLMELCARWAREPEDSPTRSEEV